MIYDMFVPFFFSIFFFFKIKIKFMMLPKSGSSFELFVKDFVLKIKNKKENEKVL